MTRSEHAANIHLTAAAQRVHVGAHFAKRGPVHPVFSTEEYWVYACGDCGERL